MTNYSHSSSKIQSRQFIFILHHHPETMFGLAVKRQRHSRHSPYFTEDTMSSAKRISVAGREGGGGLSSSAICRRLRLKEQWDRESEKLLRLHDGPGWALIKSKKGEPRIDGAARKGDIIKTAYIDPDVDVSRFLPRSVWNEQIGRYKLAGIDR